MTRRTRSASGLDRRLDALETDAREEYPEADLITVVSAEMAGGCEDVEGESDLIRCHGEVYRVPPDLLDPGETGGPTP